MHSKSLRNKILTDGVQEARRDLWTLYRLLREVPKPPNPFLRLRRAGTKLIIVELIILIRDLMGGSWVVRSCICGGMRALAWSMATLVLNWMRLFPSLSRLKGVLILRGQQFVGLRDLYKRSAATASADWSF